MTHDTEPARSQSRRSGERLRILIADDFEQWRRQIRKILSSRPEWEVIAEVCDGQQALQKAVELRPDVVLLDIGMPVLNGLQAAVRIRRQCPSSQIIFVTQANDSAVKEAALEIGAIAYVLKVNAAVELVGLIAAARENRQRELADSAAGI